MPEQFSRRYVASSGLPALIWLWVLLAQMAKPQPVSICIRFGANLHGRAASMGTLGITGLDGHISPSKEELTTQSAEYFFSAIAEQKVKGISHLAFEASSHGLAQNRLAGLGVNVAVFTNLTHDHLDFHGDMDSYFDAKAKLFDDTLLEGGTAIINIDDSYGRKLVKRLSGRHIVLWTVAKDRPADFRMSDFTLQPFGADITIDARGQSYHLAIALSGQPQAINAVMAAVAACLRPASAR